MRARDAGDPETLDPANVEFLTAETWDALDAFGKRLILTQAIITEALFLCAQRKVNSDVDGPTVGAQDFSVIDGDWVGTLTYRDYGTGELTVIATKSIVTSISDTKIKYTIFYPDEPWEDSQSTIDVSKDGRLLDGHVISGRVIGEDGTLILTTNYRGEDENRQADIRLTYGLSPTNFYIRKSDKIDDNNAYLERNIYEFKRR